MPDGRRWFSRKPKRPPHRFAAHQVAIPAMQESIKQLYARVDDWQSKVLNYAGLIPEVMTGYLFVHNVMDLVTFELQHFDRTANDWLTDDSPELQGIERRINHAFKAGRAAGLMHLVEEAYILIRRDGSDLHFETLAPTELKSKGTIVERRMLHNDKDVWVTVPHDTTIVRVYTADPLDRNRASGPHKPLIGLLESMALELSRAQADSIGVLAGNGILAIPTEILPDEADTLDASDTPGSREAFENAIEEAMTLTITDRGRGDAIVPITLYGPGEALAQIRHILPTRPEGAAEAADRMDHNIKRYANSIDLPAQVITGIGDANHWGDWKVDENTWAYHLYPRGQRIADALYAGVVVQILKNLGKDPCEYRLVPNATRAIAKPDMTRTAIDAYRLGAIKPESFVEAIGFGLSDMRPDAEEALLEIISTGHGIDAQLIDGVSQTRPERTAAASKNPRIILREAGKLANSHQRKLEELFKRFLAKVAVDAARDGKRDKKLSAKADKAAADEVPFLGYQPGTYFAKYRAELEAATNDELFAFLRRIATLTGSNYRSLRAIWAGEFQQRATAVAQQAQQAAEAVATRSYKSGTPTRIADNVIRTLTSTANGGTNQNNGAAGNTQRPTEAGADPVMREELTAAVGSYATQYTWVTGHPQRPYPPHQELDGQTWFSWEEFDALDVAPEDSWLLGNVYFPGDHDGCQCSYEIEFVLQEDAA